MPTVDITPSPRVLRMLGQIDFAPWQCLAELIDNSIDAFIDQVKSGAPPTDPKIVIALPTEAQLKNGTGEIVVSDNGRGMPLASLENAVRAGYSGNDPVEKMGLFGMGFNISTARLGRKTEVWTTTQEAPDWTGIVIDFDSLEKTRTFQAPLQSKPKTTQELSAATHGTKIVISRLEAERIRPLISGIRKRKTRERLGKIYGRIMTEMDITISYDGDRVTPRKHCVWDAKRTVDNATFGKIPAVININHELPARKFCTTCWVWLSESELQCVACGDAENIISRKRTLKGWVGVQRFFDKDHFGFDLIRNGRVIEELDKSLFTYESPEGDKIFEYPIDAIHWGGRIVGELEIDFVRVSHQKDSFDKLDPEWKRVVELVRGNSPIQPKISERLGLGKNDSPLARLFAGYRKGNAGLKDLVPGNSKGVGLNAGPLKEYEEKFHAGDPAYQTDEKWYELVLQAERAKRGESSGADEAAGDFPIGEAPTTPPTGGTGPSVSTPPVVTPPINISKPELDAELSRVYELGNLPGSPAIKVEAYKHTVDIEGRPFRVKPDAYSFRFDYNVRSKFFEESLDAPFECLLVDLAQHFLALSAQSPRDYPVAMLERDLKDKYFPQATTNIVMAAEAAQSLLEEIKRFYDENLSSLKPIDIKKLDPREIDRIRKAALKAESASSGEADEKIREGRFARYVSRAYVVELVKLWPEIITDGALFTIPYKEEAEESIRLISFYELVNSLQDVLWLSEDGSAAVNKDNAWRLRFSRSIASLRLLQSWSV